MRESLYVHLKISPEEFILVGQCVRDTALNKGVFKYAKSYVNRADAYPFDPINFPLRDEHFYLPYDKENPGIPGFILECAEHGDNLGGESPLCASSRRKH
jgi:hypothetical protein